MATTLDAHEATAARRTRPLIGWGLLIGGACFFVGGSMHPKQDPPGAGLKEHVHAMYEDPAWYPAHSILLIGMVLIAASLVALARGGSLRIIPRLHLAAVIAAVTSVAASAGMLLHLVSAVDIDRIAAHENTPVTDVLFVVETITTPAFAFSMAALAVIGAMTRTIGSRAAAVLAVLGGVGYGLAGGTFLFTDKLDALFPAAGGIALWAVAAGIGLLLHRRATSADLRPA